MKTYLCYTQNHQQVAAEQKKQVCAQYVIVNGLVKKTLLVS